MKIYAVADIHGKAERLERVGTAIERLQPDVVVVAGDITNFTGAGPVVRKLAAMAVPMLCIRGNSDRSRIDGLINNTPGMRSLHMATVSMGTVNFTGIGGTIPLPFRSRICLRENHLLKIIAPLVSKNTIVVAHPPPLGTQDRVGGRFHAGSRGLLNLIRHRSPRMVLCGHIHEDAGFSSLGQTLVVNCALSRETSGAIIDYDTNHQPRIEMVHL
ncbi:putative metallophosphoesterase (calcineurin superfamily) [Desulforapulum autotrophicum HRM2]|uniref:Metallophosphoesterase (Calcineurin superfamily) n=1 Tax=Desulforapulum autotrophicum (strain ATCC 43914 / DSM 3382 / VKM B-1955 / HRM2) TaxID=177437 RepID=C0QFS5_DESAH|nr:metallophosphoesterase [Desulforapulum autotrophicum]ACN15493.1 putative metallophosphoesterase (calcineurin superfamily) [Desulforapulum autotrophicum HRM2]